MKKIIIILALVIAGAAYYYGAGTYKGEIEKTAPKIMQAEKMEKSLEKICDDIKHICKIVGKQKPKKIYIYTIPPECSQYKSCKEILCKKFGADVQVFAVNDPKKYDPAKKSEKAKKGRPAIYLE